MDEDSDREPRRYVARALRDNAFTLKPTPVEEDRETLAERLFKFLAQFWRERDDRNVME